MGLEDLWDWESGIGVPSYQESHKGSGIGVRNLASGGVGMDRRGYNPRQRGWGLVRGIQMFSGFKV